MFADPAAVYAGFRRCILGLDTSCGSTGNIRGLNRWNLDATLAKDVRFTRARWRHSDNAIHQCPKPLPGKQPGQSESYQSYIVWQDHECGLCRTPDGDWSEDSLLTTTTYRTVRGGPSSRPLFIPPLNLGLNLIYYFQLHE